MREAFSSMGSISEIRLFKQQGYAFIRYSIKDSAVRAIMCMNGKEIKGSSIRCSWGKIISDTNVRFFNLFMAKVFHPQIF